MEVNKKEKQQLSMREFMVVPRGRAKKKMTYGKDKKKTQKRCEEDGKEI